jgi:hypothetical protein
LAERKNSILHFRPAGASVFQLPVDDDPALEQPSKEVGKRCAKKYRNWFDFALRYQFYSYVTCRDFESAALWGGAAG